MIVEAVALDRKLDAYLIIMKRGKAFFIERESGGRYGRLARSAKLSLSVRSPYVVGLLTSLPPFS